MSKSFLPRPFLKWAGGKTQLTGTLLGRVPPSFSLYHEPFVGGGAFFFCLYREQKVRQAVLSDINAELVDSYLAVRDCVQEVIELLSGFPPEPDFYYALRGRDPWSLSLAERAARMIYLNKTGYNGLYRVNRQGKFNVPFGKYKEPKYLDKDNLLAVSAALQEVEIVCKPFEAVVERVSPGEWVYFDPPYVPLSQTSSFTAYQAGGFNLADQVRLRDICVDLDKKGVYVLLSNSDTEVTRSLYAPYFFLQEVKANRAINCKGEKRGKVSELVISNYRF